MRNLSVERESQCFHEQPALPIGSSSGVNENIATRHQLRRIHLLPKIVSYESS